MATSLYDDDVLDGTPLNDTTSSNASNVPLVGLRVTANWASSDAEYPDVYGPGHVNTHANTSMKLMQSHMAAKRAQGRRDVPGGGQWSVRPTSVAPVVDLNQRNSAEGTYRFNPQTGRLERIISSRVPVSSPTMSSGGLMFSEPYLPLGVTDEYNPLIPNDYEELARIKREKRRAEEAEISARDSSMSRRPDFSDEEDEEEDEDDFTTAAFGRQRRPPPPPSKGAAIAPPAALADDEQGQLGPDNDEEEMLGSKFGINPLAAKMMARMGYREGQGLGRESQGMSTALVVEKTSRRGGKIIHEKDQQHTQQGKNPAPSTLFMNDAEEIITELPLPENRSCVILLRNMCGPGEVDDDLEPETAEECAKYGKVVTCMIFELPEASDDEAVRIFVEFEAEEAATGAILDLNGRFFAGHVVKAGFYDAEKFRNLELSDLPITA